MPSVCGAGWLSVRGSCLRMLRIGPTAAELGSEQVKCVQHWAKLRLNNNMETVLYCSSCPEVAAPLVPVPTVSIPPPPLPEKMWKSPYIDF